MRFSSALVLSILVTLLIFTQSAIALPLDRPVSLVQEGGRTSRAPVQERSSIHSEIEQRYSWVFPSAEEVHHPRESSLQATKAVRLTDPDDLVGPSKAPMPLIMRRRRTLSEKQMGRARRRNKSVEEQEDPDCFADGASIHDCYLRERRGRGDGQ